MSPYGRACPVDTGVFLIPFSGSMLAAGFVAFISGWRAPWTYPWPPGLSLAGNLILLILTLGEFWPIHAVLYYHGIESSKDTITDAQSIARTHRWVALDWVRVGGAAAALVAPLRAFTLPGPNDLAPRDLSIVRAVLAIALASVAAVIAWLFSNV